MLELLSLGGLACQEEGLEAEQVEIIDADLSVAHPVDKVIANRRR